MNSGIDLQGSFIQSLMDFGLPQGAAKALWIPLPLGLMIIGATLGVLVSVWLERKISAAVQQRIGPEHAGPLGIIQALVDGLKLLLKEDIFPAKADKVLFTLGPAVLVIPVLLSYLIIPLAQNLILSDLKIGIFFWIAVSSIAPLGLLMAGYGSNNKYAFLGGLRAAAQAISYELPLALCVLSIALRAIRINTTSSIEIDYQFH